MEGSVIVNCVVAVYGTFFVFFFLSLRGGYSKCVKGITRKYAISVSRA